MSTIEPFRIAVPDADLDDLRARLANTRWPDEVDGAGWDYGAPLAWVQDMCRYWADGYDWRAREQAINRFEQFRTEIDGVGIHFLHVRSPEPDAFPLILSHGWPGSVVEFLDSIGPLTDPSAHGGQASDAFHLVIPSLPGYGFSDRPSERGWGTVRTGRAWATLMERLGYERYGAQGGDWGAIVTRHLAEHHADRLLGAHFNMLFAFPDADDPDPMAGVTEAEMAALGEMGTRMADGTGYMAIQSTKPQTLSFGLTDSPAGLGAWILEKFHVWSDLRDGDVVETFGWDRLLDNLMAYWVTGTAGSAARLYAESRLAGTSADQPWTGRVDVPTGYAAHPFELLQVPRAWGEKRYRIVHWSEMDKGGHFAAFERPGPFVDDLRAFRRTLAELG